MATLSDFSLVSTTVKRFVKELDLAVDSQGFYYVVLGEIFKLDSTEIDDCITDTSYLTKKGKEKGHDRGIDAVFIEDSDDEIVVHLFNFKYTEIFENAKGRFPASEIEKVLGFIHSVMDKDLHLKKDANPVLYSKVEDIWKAYDGTKSAKLVVHFCSNYSEGIEKKEGERLARELKKYEATYDDILLPDVVTFLTEGRRQKIDAKIKAINKNYFDKTDGDVRALVCNVEARDLVKITCDDRDIRLDPQLTDVTVLKKVKMLEESFEENVRVYKSRSPINSTIIDTALSDTDAKRFFYFNNGITITCSKFSYQAGMRSPTIDLIDIQIVNGSQTVHALHEAFKKDPNNLENVEILLRIYETEDFLLSTQIAEYTNSQNPVKSRDIRSIDHVQIKLDKEFEQLGYMYERKRNQYKGKPKAKRIDAEKVGQALMAFNLEMPAEAKNKKALIFSEKYDEIFNEDITPAKILLVLGVFMKIEEEKRKNKKLLLEDASRYDELSMFVYTSYHLLYQIKKRAQADGVDMANATVDKLWSYYDEAVKDLRTIVAAEKNAAKEKYAHDAFFKSTEPKKRLEQLLKK